MMHNKIPIIKVCRLCGKEKDQGTDVFKDKVKGAVLISIINKYLSKEVINILASDGFSKFVCVDCEQKIYTFDEFCLTVANVQKQLAAPALEINFAEDMLCHLKENEILPKTSINSYQTNRKSICHICSKTFRCRAHLERHKLIHTGARPFICNICSMSFNQREILTKHKERHEGKKLFRCANCQQSFRYKVSLKSHLVTFHTETAESSSPLSSSPSSLLQNRCLSVLNPSLTCTECGKLFATKYKLKRHRRCHSGERPYRCLYCDRTFSQTGNLKMHQLKCHNVSCVLSDRSNSGIDHRLSGEVNQEVPSSTALNNFQSIYITESEIQKTINETLNSSVQGASYLNKSFESPIYIDEEIETMLDQDLKELDNTKYPSNNQEKVSLCLKQPETPELLHSLLYDE